MESSPRGSRNVEMTRDQWVELVGTLDRKWDALNDLTFSLDKISRAFLDTTDSPTARKWVDRAFLQLKVVADNIRKAHEIFIEVDDANRDPEEYLD
tara:strand:+ start:794 stop:1081 length:288 start_codon:yes stop_codon:yes gene_type:complete